MTETMFRSEELPAAPSLRRPRLGFLGVGWIGQHRMKAMVQSGVAEAVGLVDPSDAMMDEALRLAPGAQRMSSLEALLGLGLDGLVIATPSALHAEQAIQALERGVAVFCQKPLGRTASEASAVAAAARRTDCLLAVDFSYRFTAAMRCIRETIQTGEIGNVYAADLVFHNAYGPDKAWFYDPALSGGGCLMDLGVHLMDLALWILEPASVAGVSANLMHAGDPWPSRVVAEDFAVATITMTTGAIVRLACSWRLPAGQDAVISAAFYGTRGGAQMRNVNGSFYDFEAERFRSTQRQSLAAPPDAWGGRAAADWAVRLAAGQRFDPAVDAAVQTAHVLDQIYDAAAEPAQMAV